MSDGPNTSPRYAIGELAEAAGVSRRAVRFYVQRGLMPPPLGQGRGAHYDRSHLTRLLEIKRRQEAGMPLDAIAESFAADAPPEPAPEPTFESWGRLTLAPGVELHLRTGALSPAQHAALLHAIDSVLPTPTRRPRPSGETE